MVWHGAGHRNRWGTEAHSLIHQTVDFEASVVSGGLTSHGGDSLGLDGDSDAGPPERKTHWATKRKASAPWRSGITFCHVGWDYRCPGFWDSGRGAV